MPEKSSNIADEIGLGVSFIVILSIGIVSLVGLSWTGLIVFSAIRKGINHSWNIDKTANFVMARFIDLMMLMGGALFVIIFVFEI